MVGRRVRRTTGRANQSLTQQVLAEYGTVCWLRLPGVCTFHATTKDHIVPLAAGGTNDLANLRPACRACNSRRRDISIGGGPGATVHVVIGPPAAGKTTEVLKRASPADVVIDLDAIARALMPIQPEQTHTYPLHVRHVAIQARKAAVAAATRLYEHVHVWIIHAIPRPQDLEEYRAYKWDIITVDPGRDVVAARCATMRPHDQMAQVDRWYATYGSQDPTAPHSPSDDASRDWYGT